MKQTRAMIERFHEAFEHGGYRDACDGKPATMLTLYVKRDEVAAAMEELKRLDPPGEA